MGRSWPNSTCQLHITFNTHVVLTHLTWRWKGSISLPPQDKYKDEDEGKQVTPWQQQQQQQQEEREEEKEEENKIINRINHLLKQTSSLDVYNHHKIKSINHGFQQYPSPCTCPFWSLPRSWKATLHLREIGFGHPGSRKKYEPIKT